MRLIVTLKARFTAQYILVTLVMIFSFLATSCRDSFNPFEEQTLTFSVYGYLDTAADTQFVRIIPMRRHLQRTAEGFDGSVSITNLDTGDTFWARDSTYFLSDGTPAHIYFTVFKPEPAHRYQLDVLRNDGQSASAQTRIPNAISPDSILIFPARFSDRLFYPVYLLSHATLPFQFSVTYNVSETDRGSQYPFAFEYSGGNGRPNKLHATRLVS